ncbi:MAG: LPS assembly lipoprotein LptE [Rhodanobacter sp.]
MSRMYTGRSVRTGLLLALALALTACGFHLRGNATLPASMQRVHVTVNDNNALQRQLARALQTAGVTLEDASGPGIAELRVPVARFGSETVSAGGYTRISEFAVRYQVEFDVTDLGGQVLVPHQRIDMSREYSYDATNTVGNASQVQEIQRSLNDDMVQAILFRLQAVAKHPQATTAKP